MRKKDLIILSLIIVMNGLFASGNACFVSSPTSIVVFKTSDMTIKMNKDTLLKHACLKSEKWKMNHLIGAIMLEFQINKKEKGYWSIYIFSSDSMYMYYVFTHNYNSSWRKRHSEFPMRVLWKGRYGLQIVLLRA